MATLADLEAIIGSPSIVPPKVDWSELERLSGLDFPPDYKALADRYGMLQIDAFLDVRHVGIPANILAMLSERQRTLESLRQLVNDLGYIELINDVGEEVEAEPFPIYPERDGLFPWGSTQNGDSLLWRTHSDPRQWTVVVTDGGFWWHYDGGLVDFLVGILSRNLHCPILPRSFPSNLKVFQYSSLDQMPRPWQSEP